MKKIYLVDTENVHSVWVKFLPSLTSLDEMVLFYTANSQGLSYSDLDALRTGNYNFRMIKCFTGRNGLDFQLSSYLGYLICENPAAEFYIIANDNGYDAMIRFWSKKDILVKRLSVDTVKRMTAENINEPVPTAITTTADVAASSDLLPKTEASFTSEAAEPPVEMFTSLEPTPSSCEKPEKETMENINKEDATPKSSGRKSTSKRNSGKRSNQRSQTVSNQLEIKTLPQSINVSAETSSHTESKETEPFPKNSKAKKTDSAKENLIEVPEEFSANTSKKVEKATPKTNKAAKNKKTEDEDTKKTPIKNKTKATPIIKAALQNCSFKVTAKDITTILEVLVYDCPGHDLRSINNKLVQKFDQTKGSEIYKLLKQAKAITEVYRTITV